MGFLNAKPSRKTRGTQKAETKSKGVQHREKERKRTKLEEHPDREIMKEDTRPTSTLFGSTATSNNDDESEAQCITEGVNNNNNALTAKERGTFLAFQYCPSVGKVYDDCCEAAPTHT